MLLKEPITADELHATLKNIKMAGGVCHFTYKKCEELVPIINEINELKHQKNAIILRVSAKSL